MAFFDSRCDSITAFLGRSVSNWTMALKNWNTTRDSEEAGKRGHMAENASTAQTPHRTVNGRQTDLEMMELDTISLE